MTRYSKAPNLCRGRAAFRASYATPGSCSLCRPPRPRPVPPVPRSGIQRLSFPWISTIYIWHYSKQNRSGNWLKLSWMDQYICCLKSWLRLFGPPARPQPSWTSWMAMEREREGQYNIYIYISHTHTYIYIYIYIDWLFNLTCFKLLWVLNGFVCAGDSANLVTGDARYFAGHPPFLQALEGRAMKMWLRHGLWDGDGKKEREREMTSPWHAVFLFCTLKASFCPYDFLAAPQFHWR